MKDLFDAVLDARRSVGDTTLPAGDGKVITVERTYPYEIDDVWSAITEADRISRWLTPITGDLRLGGTYQLEGNAGGEIRVCEPPTRLLVTWIFGEAAGPEDASLVEVRLAPSGDGTTLTLEHRAVVPPEMWDQFGPGAVGIGWDLSLLGLDAHLAGNDVPPAEQLEADATMRDFMTESSRRWGEAYAASGADPDTVAAAVAGSTAAYVPPIEA
jgi:uncharacterized protein YndB with AHSA1/START domain